MNDVDLLDLCSPSGDGAPDASCPAPTPMNRPDSQGVALRTAEGNPLLCGGRGDLKRTEECEEYVPETGEWIQVGGERTLLIYAKHLRNFIFYKKFIDHL